MCVVCAKSNFYSTWVNLVVKHSALIPIQDGNCIERDHSISTSASVKKFPRALRSTNCSKHLQQIPGITLWMFSWFKPLCWYGRNQQDNFFQLVHFIANARCFFVICKNNHWYDNLSELLRVCMYCVCVNHLVQQCVCVLCTRKTASTAAKYRCWYKHST